MHWNQSKVCRLPMEMKFHSIIKSKQLDINSFEQKFGLNNWTNADTPHIYDYAPVDLVLSPNACVLVWQLIASPLLIRSPFNVIYKLTQIHFNFIRWLDDSMNVFPEDISKYCRRAFGSLPTFEINGSQFNLYLIGCNDWQFPNGEIPTGPISSRDSCQCQFTKVPRIPAPATMCQPALASMMPENNEQKNTPRSRLPRRFTTVTMRQRKKGELCTVDVVDIELPIQHFIAVDFFF